MTQTTLPVPLDVEVELEKIAQRYRQAGGVGINILNMIGGQAESLLDRLPTSVRSQLETATVRALDHAMTAAHKSRGHVPDQASWLNSATSAAMGAIGGAGGLPTALAELPVTTTLLLRVIEGVAVEYGFDPELESVRFDCVQVFASAGPLAEDDGSDLAFLTARLALSGKAVQAIIHKVAPKLAVVMGQKLAAQTVPVLGAVTGAATNYAYTSYYQDMAHVHFGLRRLAIEGDVPSEELTRRLATRMKELTSA